VNPAVIRYGLSRDACFLVCAQNVLTADLADKVVSASILNDCRSGDCHISFDVQAAFNAIPGAKFVAGHSGFDGELHHFKIVIADQFYRYMSKCIGELGR
jgi:hypothetical protein